MTGSDPTPERRRKAPGRRRLLSGPGIAEARDHVIPAFTLGAPGLRGSAFFLCTLFGSTVRPGVAPLVVEGGSRGGNGPALAVDGEAQLCIVGFPIAKFGTCFGVRRVAGAAGAGWEVGAEVPVLARRQALVWIVAGHDTYLECGSNTVRSCFATIRSVTIRAVSNA